MNSNRFKFFFSVLAGFIFVLSVAHHAVNFWGLEIFNELLVLVVAVPILASGIFWLVNRVWEIIAAIEKKRWALFLLPAVIVAAIFTWRFHQVPSVWHTLKIIPNAGGGQITLYEIKYPPGRVVKFSKVAVPQGWIVEDNALKTKGKNSATFEYSFFSPVGEATTLLFEGHPQSGSATIILDGRSLEVNLNSANASQIPVEMIAAYKLGISGEAILFVVILIDFLFFLLLLTFFWLLQEIPQTVAPGNLKMPEDRFLSHRAGLLVLLSLAVVFHALNALAVPLIVGPDSPSFLSGAFHLVQYGNLDGVPAARGPGMALLLAPAIWLFGSSPWGVKATLHLVAIACVPLAYALGWQIFRRRAFAFFAGLALIWMPDLYLYSNIVMSDVPNIFLPLAFCALLIPTLRTFSPVSVIACMMTASLATLHRPENMVLIALAVGFLVLKIIWDQVDLRARFQLAGIALLLALLPLLAWSAHNKRVYGFFGLSNYAGAIWYDGWVYFGEASKVHITDLDSPAVKAIAEAVAAYDKPIDSVAAPTSLEMLPALLEYGYTEEEAMKIFETAGKDSIRNNPRLTLELYFIKLRESFIPEYNTVVATSFWKGYQFKNDYFDAEQPLVPALVDWQRKAYDLLQWENVYIYRPLVLFSLAAMFLAVYQKDFFKWAPLVVVTASRLFITTAIGLGNWRYVLSGVPLLFLFALLAIEIARGFIVVLKNPKGVENL